MFTEMSEYMDKFIALTEFINHINDTTIYSPGSVM